MISQLLDQLHVLAGRVKKTKAVNVNSQAVKEGAVALASSYFREHRPEIAALLGDSPRLQTYDSNWQRLLRLAQGNNAKTSYVSTLRSLLDTTKDVNVASHAIVHTPVPHTPDRAYSEAEEILLQTLENLAPSAAASYRQAIDDLAGPGARHSHRGTASELRESFRDVLDHLAPDIEVQRESWYKPEANQTRPTMKQKVRFVLSSRGKNKTQRAPAEETVQLIEEMHGSIGRAFYSRASLSTHVDTTRDEVVQLKRYLDALLFDLLEIR